MSLSHEVMLELMSLADGELEGSDRERVERLVAGNDEARRVVESLRGAEVASWLGAAMDRRAMGGGADGIADAVMAAATGGSRASQSPPARAASGVASLAEARSRRTSRVQLFATAAAGVLAIAAGVALYVHAGVAPLDGHAPVASVTSPPVDLGASTVAQRGLSGGVEVNEIDAPSRGVSVFEIPVGAAAAVASPTGASGASSVVVWVEDEQEGPATK